MTGIPAEDAPRSPWAQELYEEALLRGGGGLELYGRSGRAPADVARWCAPADSVDQAVLARCVGPTLDAGCGPGRLVAALAARGVPVLGVDVAPGALALARRSGAPVLQRSVFDRLPGEGRWREVLLLDGNLGIGGDPAALLDRVRTLLAPDGVLLAEVEPEEVDETGLVSLVDDRGRASRSFRWARLGAAALRRRAAAAGLHPVEDWSGSGRRFLVLEPAPDSARRVRWAPRTTTSIPVPTATASSSPVTLAR